MSNNIEGSAAEANSHQVGGDHYRTDGVQHWDLMADYDVPYLTATATKYISRWRKKNGVQDLEKALHYVEKAIEQWKSWVLPFERKPTRQEIESWADTAGLTLAEYWVCQLILDNDLVSARTKLQEMIEVEKARPAPISKTIIIDCDTGLEYRPGTPEDGGHHARQPQDAEWSGRLLGEVDIYAKRLPLILEENEFLAAHLSVRQRYEIHDHAKMTYCLRSKYRHLAENDGK